SIAPRERHHFLQQRRLERGRGKAYLADLVTRARVELQSDVGAVGGGIHHHLVAAEAGIEIAAPQGEILQGLLGRLIIAVVERLAGPQRQLLQDRRENRVVLGGARQPQLHRANADLLPRRHSQPLHHVLAATLVFQLQATVIVTQRLGGLPRRRQDAA